MAYMHRTAVKVHDSGAWQYYLVHLYLPPEQTRGSDHGNVASYDWVENLP